MPDPVFVLKKIKIKKIRQTLYTERVSLLLCAGERGLHVWERLSCKSVLENEELFRNRP